MCLYQYEADGVKVVINGGRSDRAILTSYLGGNSENI